MRTNLGIRPATVESEILRLLRIEDKMGLGAVHRGIEIRLGRGLQNAVALALQRLEEAGFVELDLLRTRLGDYHQVIGYVRLIRHEIE